MDSSDENKPVEPKTPEVIALKDEVDQVAELPRVIRRTVDKSVRVVISNEKIRSVQTQHGDYRTVDEENIVIIKNCLSPVHEPDLTLEPLEEATDLFDMDLSDDQVRINFIKCFFF